MRVVKYTNTRPLQQGRVGVFSFTFFFASQLYVHTRFVRTGAATPNRARSYGGGIIATSLLLIFCAALLVWRFDAFIMWSHRDAM